MKENLYYLFIAGIFLSSGPCLGSCGPVLVGYSLAHKPGVKKALVAYGTFLLGKLLAYLLLGIVCAAGANLLQNTGMAKYTDWVTFLLGGFVFVMGISTLFFFEQSPIKVCRVFNRFHHGHLRNMGLLGFLIGLSPCLPLFGILNYVVVISRTPAQAVFFMFVFGLGTLFSPIIFLIIFSGKAHQFLLYNAHVKNFIRLACGILLLILAGRIFFIKAILPF